MSAMFSSWWSTTSTVDVAEIETKLHWPQPYIVLGLDILASVDAEIMALTSRPKYLGLIILSRFWYFSLSWDQNIGLDLGF